MKESGDILKNTMILSFGRILGFALSFFTPFFLSRWLPVNEYGTYKQVMLIWMFLFQIANWGMDDGLFFFIKSDPSKKSVFSLNTIIFDSGVTSIIALFFILFPDAIAFYMNNPDLKNYLPLFSILLLISIPIQHFEHLLITVNKVKHALAMEVTFELSKSCIILACFYYSKSLNFIITGLIALLLIKFSIVLTFLFKDFSKNNLRAADIKEFLPKQVKHGIPLGTARFFNMIVYFDKFIISALFTLKQFTIYSVGCFEIPIILGISCTIWDLTSMDMVSAHLKKNLARLKELWSFAITKIMQFYIPICVYFFIFAEEIITFIFSETYKESVPFFRVYIFIFMLYSLNFEAVFRAFSANTALLKIQFLNLIISVSLIVGLGYFLGPLPALVGKLIAQILITLIMFGFISKTLSFSLEEIVDWRQIQKIILISIPTSLLFKFISDLSPIYLFFKLALTFTSYSMIILISFYHFNILQDSEKEYINSKLKKLRPIY